MITKMKIKKGDTVLVRQGKNRGKKGAVIRVYPERNKVLVNGVNERTRHIRPKKAGEKGQRVKVFHPLPVSNVMIVCPHCSKATRVGIEVRAESKVRICKKCKGEL